MLRIFFFLITLPLALTAFSGEQPHVEVDTTLGRIRGFRHKLKDSDQEIAIFFGVPFAQPPEGDLRFEKPRSPSKWRGIRDATKPKSACIYHAWPAGLEKGEKTYSEDCLYVNIFAPHQRNGSNVPVLVIIHGGGFEVGSSHTYHNYEDIGAKFVANEILVASIDYRLGWIGFGSTGDSEMPGNLGLWDQLAALKFLRANVHAFGGDPERITLYGYSAGSASVSLLSISPHSRDLFNQSIQMSGSPFAAWALNERAVNETRELAKALKCPKRKSIKQCLTEKPVSKVWSAVDQIGPTRYADVNFAKWAPRIDGDFFPVDIPQLIQAAKPKPTLMGFVELESLCWTLFTGVNDTLAAFAIPWDQLDQYGRERFEQSVGLLVAKPEFFGNDAEEVKRQIVQNYLREDPLAEFSQLQGWHFPHYYLQRYSQMLSDLNFIMPILTELQLKAHLGWPIHFYQNVHYNMGEFPKPVKVHQNFHTNDENFMFRESHFPFTFELTDEDNQVESHLVQMLANFVKFGNPSPKSIQWLPVSKAQPSRHLRITATPKMEGQFDEEVQARFAFWQQFGVRYGRQWDPVRGAARKF